MSDLKYKIVDAFAFAPFTGNPAGVVLNAEGLSDGQLVRIARAINLSETAFVFPADRAGASVKLRWFTPAVEIAFCGHATLGAVHALMEEGRFGSPMAEPGMTLPIQYGRGALTIRTEHQDDSGHQCVYWFDAPDVTLSPPPQPAERFCALLGIAPTELDRRIAAVKTAEGQVILGVEHLDCLWRMTPDMQALAQFGRKHGVRGVAVTTLETPTAAVLCQTRYFAPACGVDEDPVTGSLHGPLATHLVQCGLAPGVDGRYAFQCGQSRAGDRAGVVRVVVTRDGDAFRARVGGACHTVARGAICRPPAD
jgi:PhzF family phenazine biosynthesis protein